MFGASEVIWMGVGGLFGLSRSTSCTLGLVITKSRAYVTEYFPAEIVS